MQLVVWLASACTNFFLRGWLAARLASMSAADLSILQLRCVYDCLSA